MKKGDKLICLENINNPFNKPLFKKDGIYEVLYVDNEGVTPTVCINHILYANEYSDFDLEWVLKNFKIC
jgi:hypothetical protein